MAEPAERSRAEQRELIYVAIARVLSTPAFIATTLVAGDEISTGLTAWLVFGTAYTTVALAVVASRHWERVDPRAFAVADLFALAAVMAMSGGPTSQVKLVFFIWPIGMSLLFGPRETMLCLFAAVGTYVAVSIPFVVDSPLSLDDPELQALVLNVLALAWIGAVTVFTAYSFDRRRERIERLSAARRHMLADALNAEERTRQELFRGLQDETLEVLIAADQDLEAGTGDHGMLERAREGIRLAVRQLRELVRELHPTSLLHGGLAGGIDVVMERAGREGSFAVDVRVDPQAAGEHDALLISLARALAGTAARHARDETLSLEVRREGGEVRMEVTGTGTGQTSEDGDQVVNAWRATYGLLRERVEAAGGSFDVEFTPGGGDTRVLLALPVAGAAPASGRERRYDHQDLIDVAWIRVLTLPLFVALTVVAGQPFTTALWVVIAALTVLVIGQLLYFKSDLGARLDPRPWILSDLACLAIAMAVSGGPSSQLGVIFLVQPLVLSLLYSPRLIAGCLLGAMATYALVSLPFVIDDAFSVDQPELRDLVLVELSLAWVGSISIFAADSFTRRRERIERLSANRQRVLGDVLAAEDAARRTLAQSLHDGVLQVLMAAGQDLDAGMRGSDASIRRAGEELRMSVNELRQAARGLQPAGAEYGGLAAGLDAVAERAGQMGGMEVDVRVDHEAAGVHDALLIALARELATNAAKHAEAGRLALTVRRMGHNLLLEVIDDGRGIDPGRTKEAIAEGHIGLASCRERIQAAGGMFQIGTGSDGGTVVTVSLPAPQAPSREAPVAAGA